MYPMLQLDLRLDYYLFYLNSIQSLSTYLLNIPISSKCCKHKLISDLIVVIASATCGGIAFACAGQPVITGYLLVGSVIGPGGFSFVSEMVLVCYFCIYAGPFPVPPPYF
ncbi:hypothetical protein WN944_001104 [Citrus x changshan-huyou]|uniref:Uncharacterized protein n=1 Tax=Citrus x changshan-huyou TaxID=2935761 RepID=A0AAP0MGK9_9ROSI